MQNFQFGLMCLVVLANVLIDGSFYPILYVGVAILHEAGHLIALFSLGQKIDDFRFVGFGIRIEKTCLLTYEQELYVSVLGPMVNFFLMFVLGGIYCYNNVAWLQYGAVASGMYGLMNLLPIAPLDGYAILKNWLMMRGDYFRVCKALKWVSIICLVVFGVILFVLYINKFLNLSIVLIYLVLLFGTVGAQQ